MGASGLLSPLAPPTAPAGDYPVGVVVSPDGASVYVADEVRGAVLQYDRAADGELTPKSPATVPAGSAALGVAISPDGDHLYVTNLVPTPSPSTTWAPPGSSPQEPGHGRRGDGPTSSR